MVKNKVKERREELGMTLSDLSDESGVPISTISEIEQGAEPKILTAMRIAFALGVTVEELWII